MKTKLFFSLLAFIALATVSCNKDESVYSCDKNVDVWVKNNLTEIQQMTRDDFLRLPENYQWGVFRAFTAEQRISIWKAKIKEILLLEWTDVENTHIQALLLLIEENPTWFSGIKTDEERDKYELAAYKWIIYAEEILDWDMKTIYGIAGNPNRLSNTNDSIEEQPTQLANALQNDPPQPPPPAGTVDCNCHATESNLFLCPSDTYKCVDREISKCKYKDFGCGILWLTPCHGLCMKKN